MAALHKISVPDFGRLLGGEEGSKDKPRNTYPAYPVALQRVISRNLRSFLTQSRDFVDSQI